MMGFSILWCVRKGHTQVVCKCCSLCDLLQAMSSHSPTVSIMRHHGLGPKYPLLFPSRLSGLIQRPGETIMFLFRPSKQRRQGIPFPPPSKGLTPSPMVQHVLQEVHALVADPSFHQHQLFATQRAQDTGFSVTDPAFDTSTEPRETACSATLQRSAGPVSAQAATECSQPGD